jgi:hypothetical protein
MLGRIVWVLVLTLLSFAYLTVGLRLWVRYRITKSPGWDDATMVVTLVSTQPYPHGTMLKALDPLYIVLRFHPRHHDPRLSKRTF